jgi:hypothetical protein
VGAQVVEVLAQCEAKLMRLMDSVEGEQPAADGTDPNASDKMLASQVRLHLEPYPKPSTLNPKP